MSPNSIFNIILNIRDGCTVWLPNMFNSINKEKKLADMEVRTPIF